MYFVMQCTDRTDVPGLRQATRPVHLEWIAALGRRLLLAGPLLDAAGTPLGSLLVIEGETAAEIEALAATDPYAKAGLFLAVTVTPFRVVVSNPVGA